MEEFYPNVPMTVNIEKDADGAVAVFGDFKRPVIDTLMDLKILQPVATTTDKVLGKHNGEFLCPEMEQFHEQMMVLPIGIIGFTKRCFAPFDSGKQLLCWSNDRLAPSPRMEGKSLTPFSPVCGRYETKNGRERYVEVCEKAIWVGNKKPDCSDVLGIAVMSVPDCIPYRLQLKGKGLGAWNKFKAEWKKKKNVARLKGQKLVDFVLNLSTQSGGSFFEPVFDFIEGTDINPAQYVPLAVWYQTLIFKAQQADEADAEAGGAVAGSGTATTPGTTEVLSPAEELASQSFAM